MKLSKIDGRSALFFLFGLSSAIYFSASVQIVFIEIVSVIASFLAVFRNSKSINQAEVNSETTWIMRLFWVWLLTQIIVDLYRNAENFESLKTFATIITLISLLYCAKIFFLHNSRNLTAFLFGYIFSCIPSFVFFPSAYARSQPWKFCFGMYITLLVFWILQKYHVRTFGFMGSILSLVAIDLYTNSRSLAVLTILTALSIIYSKSNFSRHPFVFAILIIVILTYGEKLFLHYASAGLFGAALQTKTVEQVRTGPILLVARSEFLYEVTAIKSNWIIGSGSSPTVGTAVLNEVWKTESELGINSKATAAFRQLGITERLPQHSMLFGAWVEGGILSVLVWLYIFKLFISWFLRQRNQYNEFDYVLKFMLVSMIWALLFSPLGTGSRLTLVLTLIIGAFYNRSEKRAEP